MNSLDIEGSKFTPRVLCDLDHGTVLIAGYSYPENAIGFYRPLLDWLGGYLERDGAAPLQIEIALIYFNSSSSKILLDMFDLLDGAAAAGRKVGVQWHYDPENETALECGQEFKEGIVHLSFALVPGSA